MAVAIKKLEDQLNCSICLDTYTNPKQLQCSHVYCQQCLVKLVIRDQQEQLVLTCPNCRHITPVPAGGVAGLQSAFQIKKFLDIVEEHKKTPASTSTQPATTITCLTHNERAIELYCETCMEAICYKCIKKDEKHHSHDYKELDKAFEKYKEEIASLLEPMEEQLVAIKKALVELDTRRDEITNQQSLIEADIHKAIWRQHETLAMREAELIHQLYQLTMTKLKRLEAQKEQILAAQAELDSYLHSLKETLTTTKWREALTKKTSTASRVKELTTTFQSDTLEPNTEADMIFSALIVDPNAECHNYGKVYAAGAPDPSRCYAKGKGVVQGEVTVEENSIVFLRTMNANNQPCNPLTTNISCELVSEITNSRVEGSVERRGQNKFKYQHKITYQPTVKGRHQLHVTVDGRHIRGSPFPVVVRSSGKSLTAPIFTISGVEQPMGVTVNKKGEVVVTEGGKNGHCVTVFSSSGERLRSFGTQGSGEGQFHYPHGVTVDLQENIFVADNYNHRVQKFTAQGKFLKAVGTKGSGPLQFHYPCGLAFNPTNSKVYVVDSENCRVQILNSDLSYSSAFGKRGSKAGQLNNPDYITCNNRTGNVFVADNYNHRVQVFTAEGKFLRMLGRHGEEELKNPNGIAVDSSGGRVYVSEQWNHCISEFTLEGELVRVLGSEGAGLRELTYPLGLDVDSSGVVYVCDSGNNRIQLL